MDPKPSSPCFGKYFEAFLFPVLKAEEKDGNVSQAPLLGYLTVGFENESQRVKKLDY